MLPLSVTRINSSLLSMINNNVFTDFSKITKQFPAMTQQDYIALVNQANRASYEYYVLSRPSMSDADFDKIIMYLEGCEYEHPEWIVPDSPTQRVGSDLSANGRRTIAHRTPMLSCQKAQTVASVENWRQNLLKNGLSDGDLILYWK